MKEIILTTLVWILNIGIIIGGILYAYQVWQDRRRALYGIIAFAGGTLWHIYEILNAYNNRNCRDISETDNWIIIGNKCLPLSDNVIYAQMAIFTGLFVFIALAAKRYSKLKR